MPGPIHDSFREGGESFDLTEAKRLLSEVAILRLARNSLAPISIGSGG